MFKSNFKYIKKGLHGFTIVELLVVIVVIGILATVTIVAYTGVSNRAKASAIQADLSSASKQLELYKAEHGAYPIDGNSADETAFIDALPCSDGLNCDSYTSDGTSYHLTITDGGSIAYNVTNGGVVEEGEYVGDGWKSIASGEDFACGISMDDYVYCWGDNTSGQLGDGTNDDSSVPVLVNVNNLTVKQIALGMDHACAIGSDDNAYCWGLNEYGQIGDDSTTNRNNPVAVNTGVSSALQGKTVRDIYANYGHTCVIASDSKAYCWGLNGYGQLGDNSTTSSDLPVAVNGGMDFGILAVGGQHTCGIASDGFAYCWGNNNMGQLGDDTSDPKYVPTAVFRTGLIAGKTLADITAGSNDSCLVASDGSGYCWGENWNGQLGNNDTNPSDVPVRIVHDNNLAGKSLGMIRAGGMHTCATTTDNKIYCWGWGLFGQLGNNQTSDSLEPVAVLGSVSTSTVNSFSSGLFFSCALLDDNSAYCWGHNASGQLGDGTTTNSSVPVLVAIP